MNAFQFYVCVLDVEWYVTQKEQASIGYSEISILLLLKFPVPYILIFFLHKENVFTM
jgi:hypothetical protein